MTQDFLTSYTVLVAWKKWFAWYPVRLQIGDRVAWLCVVEYEQIRMGRPSGAYGSGPRTVTHYRPVLP